MTDPITTPAQMREAAALLATSFLVGDPQNGVPLRNPMAHEIAAAIHALPVAEPQKPQAVKVKPLVWRDFADVSCAPYEKHGDNLAVALCSYFDGHLECPEDGEDGSELDEFDCWKVWVSDSAETVLRRIAQVANARVLAALEVSETTESERQATRDSALEDAAQAVSNRATYWWAEATAADDAGRKKLSLSYEAKALACTELAAVIRVMKGTTE